MQLVAISSQKNTVAHPSTPSFFVGCGQVLTQSLLNYFVRDFPYDIHPLVLTLHFANPDVLQQLLIAIYCSEHRECYHIPLIVSNPGDVSLSETKIIATHDLELVTALGRRTVILHKGEIVADGNTETVLNDISLLRAHGLAPVEKSFQL